MKTMILSGHDYQAEVQIKSPMGWISAQGSITILSETAFSGSVKLMGFTAELTDCARDGAHLCFTASPKLPFGVLRVEIEADVADAGTVKLDAEQMEKLNDAKTEMESAKAQLSGSDYSRMLLYLTLPVSGDETYAFIDTVRAIAQSYYPDGNVYVAGESTTEYDFEKSFARDNTVVSLVSILIVLVVLLFTFQSAGMPILLILVIQGSIWINFSIPALTQAPLFFMSYLVVSAIQMGANIDYAIVIANRYQELKNRMPHREAMIESLNFAFPTVITSGTIMTVGGILIGQMTSEASIVGIGQSIGRGTIISMLLVLFVLPQILLLGGGPAAPDTTQLCADTAALRTAAASHFGNAMGELREAMSALRGINAQMDHFFAQLDTEIQDAQQAAEAFLDALDEAAQWVEDLSGEDFEGFSPIGTRFDENSSALNDSLGGISNELSALNSELADSNTALLSDLRAVNQQFMKVMNLFLNALNDTQNVDYTDVFEDVSEENLQSAVRGRVLECSNHGAVSADRNAGGIAGEVTGQYSGNCFVSDTLAGIDRVSYAGKAEQISYDQLRTLEGIPDDFLHLTLSFVADGKTLKTEHFDYGDSFTDAVYPEAPEKEGFYVRWDRTDLRGLQFDTVVTAVYEPYVTTLASEAARDGHAAVLAEGQFRAGDRLQAAMETEAVSAPGSAAEVWTLRIPDDGQQTHTVRWRLPAEGKDVCTVYTNYGDGWKKVRSEQVGSYLCFDMTGSGRFAVAPAARTAWWAAVLAFVAGGVILAVCWRGRKKRARQTFPARG